MNQDQHKPEGQKAKKKKKIIEQQNYFEGSLVLPSCELSITDMCEGQTIRQVQIKGRGLTEEQAVLLFDHALVRLRETKEGMEKKEKGK